MILLIDNYDSFTYNVVQRLGEIDPLVDVRVVRNDELSVGQIEALKPDRLIVSPGPCTPNEAGVSIAAIRQFAGKIPILGICLGHQSIGQAFGGQIVRAPQLMHGMTDAIYHNNLGLFSGLPNPFIATRYHSLVIAPESLPKELVMTGWTDTGGTRQIMGVRHRELPIEGWQFHPESFLTEVGTQLLQRFMALQP